MSKLIKDLKIKKVGSEERSNSDALYSANGTYISEKEAERIKKKKSKRRFYTGFACVSLIVILIASVFLGALVAWDANLLTKNDEKISLKDMTGLELLEAVGMLAKLYEDGSGVVTNKYEESDLDNFYTDLKGALYLSEDCNVTIKDIVSGLLSSLTNKDENTEGDGGEQATLSDGSPLIMSDETAPEIGDNGSITGNKELDKLLESLEFDFSVLEGRDQDTLEREMLELSDRELAAVLNEALGEISEVDALKNIENDYGIKIADVASVEQVVIDEATVLDQSGVRVRATLCLNLRKAASDAVNKNKEQIVSKLFGDKDVPDFVYGLVSALPGILPEKMYVTASVYPNMQTWEANVAVNNMSEKQQAAVNSLLNNLIVSKDADGNEIPFMRSINEKIYDTIVKVDEIVPINFVPSSEGGSGNFETKPIQAVINLLGAENLAQGDFLALIRDVKLPTAESLGVDGFSEEAQTLAADKFINGEFSEKYYFNNVVNAETNEYFITASNLFSKINTFSEDEETLKRIEIRDRIVAGEQYGDGGAYRPFADNDTLAALLNGYLKNQAYEIENMEPWIMDVLCTETGKDDAKGDYFTLRITIELDLTGNIDAQLKDNESMKKLVKQILPDSIYVFLTYTQYSGTAETPSSAIVDINKKGNDMSRQHFETLMSLLKAVEKKNGNADGESGEGTEGDGSEGGEDVSEMTFDELEAQLNQKIYDAFVDIEKNLGAKIEFVTQTSSSDGGAILPNIFEVLAANEKLKYDPETDGNISEEDFYAKNAISGEEMYLILSQTYKYDPEADDSDVKTNVDEAVAALGITGFVSEIDSKYYIDTDGENDDWSTTNIEKMLDTVSGEYETRLRMNSVTTADGVKIGLLDDKSEYSSLNPYLSQYEFANIVNDSGKLNNMMQIMPEGKLCYILIYRDENNAPKIRMRINGAISFDNVTGEGADAVAQNKKYETLFPYDVDIIVDISVSYDVDGNEIYEAEVDINDIGDSYLDKMLFFVKRFSGQTSIGEGENKNEFTKEGLETTIENKIRAAFNDMNAGGKVETEFVEKSETEGGLEFSTVFELAVNNIYTDLDDEKPSGEVMRSTIKGLHAGMNGYTLANGDYVSPIDESATGGDGTSEEKETTFTLTPSTDGLSLTVTAQFLDAYMNTKIKGENFADIVGGNDGDISSYQSYILPRYANGTAIELGQTQAVREYYNEGLTAGNERIDNDTSYLLVTLKVVTENLFTGENATGKNNNLVPSEIYINAMIALLENPDADSQAQTQIFVNRMTDEECAVMNRILRSAGYEKDLFGGSESTKEMIDRIYATNLVNYDYNYNVTIPGLGQQEGVYPITITVEDVVDASYVWFCSLYDQALPVDDRKDYIKNEVSYTNTDNETVDKLFGATGDDRRFGIAYLRYEKTLSIQDYIGKLINGEE